MSRFPKDQWGYTVEPDAIESNRDAAQLLDRMLGVRMLQVLGGPLGPMSEDDYRSTFPDDSEEEMRSYLDSYDPEDAQRSHEHNIRVVQALSAAVDLLLHVPCCACGAPKDAHAETSPVTSGCLVSPRRSHSCPCVKYREVDASAPASLPVSQEEE